MWWHGFGIPDDFEPPTIERQKPLYCSHGEVAASCARCRAAARRTDMDPAQRAVEDLYDEFLVDAAAGRLIDFFARLVAGRAIEATWRAERAELLAENRELKARLRANLVRAEVGLDSETGG